MTQDALELQLQDYLDDRMSDGERHAFEERLANEPGLARRLRDLRAISEALDQDDPDLPPGFHTRLRARFESRHSPARRWFGLMSWETAGLVAAVAVVAVLFVPVVMEKSSERPESQILIEPADKEFRQNQSRDEVEEDRIEEDADFAPTPESLPEPVVEPEATLEFERRDEPAKSRPAPPSSAKLKKADQPVALEQAPAESERQKRSRSGEKGAAGAAVDSGATATGRRATVGEVKDELRAQSEGFDDRSVAPGGVALAEGGVARGEVLEIRTEEQWRRLALRIGPTDGEILGDYDPGSRLVLVGPRETPIDCARSVVVAVADAHEIRLAPATDPATEAVHGCVFRVPADDLPVRLIGPASVP